MNGNTNCMTYTPSTRRNNSDNKHSTSFFVPVTNSESRDCFSWQLIPPPPLLSKTGKKKKKYSEDRKQASSRRTYPVRIYTPYRWSFATAQKNRSKKAAPARSNRTAHLLPHHGSPDGVVLDGPVHQGLRLTLGLEAAVGERRGRRHRHGLQRRRVDQLIDEAHLERLLRSDVLPFGINRSRRER